MVSLPIKSKRKRALILAGLFGVFVLLVLFSLEMTNKINLFTPSRRNTTAGPTKAQQKQEQQADTQAKQAYLDSVYGKSGTNDSDKNTSPTPSPKLGITPKQDGDNIIVLAKIQSVAQGTCKLSIHNNGKTTEQTAQVIYQPEFSSCAGFSVSKNTLGSGLWDITMTVTTTEGAALSQSTTLEVK